MNLLVGLGGVGKLKMSCYPSKTEEQKHDILFIKLDNSLGEALCEQLEKAIAEKASSSQTESDEEQTENICATSRSTDG